MQTKSKNELKSKRRSEVDARNLVQQHPKKIYIFRNETCQMLNDLAAVNNSRKCVHQTTDDNNNNTTKEVEKVKTEIMRERAELRLRERWTFMWKALKDFRPIKTFDYDAFISYVIWSTVISVIRLTFATQGASPVGTQIIKLFISKPTAFYLLYVALPYLALFSASYKIETAKLTDRRIILAVIFSFIGLIAGYYYPQKYRAGSNDFCLPVISNFVFYFLASSFKEFRLLLLGICILVPASMSAWCAYLFHYFDFTFCGNLINNCAYIYLCLQLNIRSYTVIGAKSQKDIFKMVIRVAVLTEFLGNLSFFF